VSLEVEIVRISVEDAHAQDLISALDRARAGYLAAPACRSVEVLLSEVGNEVAAIITWTSAEAHAVALERPEAKTFFQEVARFAVGKPDVQKYRSAVSLT
jgi:quinol monooxygenase YgiN